ncbi:MAG TPA: LysM peptidoglycan-binding domain-containing protein [Anaerolineales bacterium]|nr:LysM peptidoglycan-binding domain-containing protein [Anaerolineales bacterium]HNO30152.1 LysM peptidoglycan-binding domain-containing protein [Anaerolineales bacterium]
MRGYRFLFLLLFIVLTSFNPRAATAQGFDPTPTLGAPPNPAEIINAINALRASYGLSTLNAHPILMQIAQEEASGIASGLPGHWRPRGLTLGQWMISLGYPLSGDLTLDGYRSENWVQAYTAEDAVNVWLGDDLHTNTMLSTERSDIGAGVAVGEDSFYIVIETALQTRSGQMQSNAYAILTGIPMTQQAYSAMETQAAANGVLPQYSVPVAMSTPLSNGKVYHEVRYGQTLWSIAIAYGTTIKQIQSLNNLGDSIVVYEGEVLLVQMGATQPAPSSEATVALAPTTLTSYPTLTLVPTHPSVTPENKVPQNEQGTRLGVIVIALSALFLAGVFAVIAVKKVP